jgi:hypothetical protein
MTVKQESSIPLQVHHHASYAQSVRTAHLVPTNAQCAQLVGSAPVLVRRHAAIAQQASTAHLWDPVSAHHVKQVTSVHQVRQFAPHANQGHIALKVMLHAPTAHQGSSVQSTQHHAHSVLQVHSAQLTHLHARTARRENTAFKALQCAKFVLQVASVQR